MNEYGALDRLLHRMALSSRYARKMAFDADCALSAPSTAPRKPTYVAGLARAGTTILLEALYSTNEFVTLTYRNMPFVMAPTLWSRISAAHRRESALSERAHGDGLEVGFDSPEAFEEVFWLTVTKGAFIRESCLEAHTVDDASLHDYRRYVGSILGAARSPHKRYLAKNNNNVLRLASLQRAFRDAYVIVPFRNPHDHATSLLRQHRRFCETHAVDPFARRYMSWLGHFEFGLDMKPFRFGDSPKTSAGEAGSLDYWVAYWSYVYEHVIATHGDRVIFFDYDGLLAEPERTLATLAERIGVPESGLIGFAMRIRRSEAAARDSPALPAKTRHLHEALVARAQD